MRLLLHSNRGAQYGSGIYRDFIARHGFTGSMSGKGCCYDIAKVERFFDALKDQLVADKALVDPEEMHRLLAGWIEAEYNYAYPHSGIDDFTPAEFEQLHGLKEAA